MKSALAIFIPFGLTLIVWAIERACSTFDAGPRTWTGFLENWKYSADLKAIKNGELVSVTLSIWQRIQVSIRMIPLSRFPNPVEQSQPDQGQVQSEAKPSC